VGSSFDPLSNGTLSFPFALTFIFLVIIFFNKNNESDKIYDNMDNYQYHAYNRYTLLKFNKIAGWFGRSARYVLCGSLFTN
jgi:hypothetical protein